MTLMIEIDGNCTSYENCRKKSIMTNKNDFLVINERLPMPMFFNDFIIPGNEIHFISEIRNNYYISFRR